MKHVSLLRHAKSSWSEAALEDFDRPLNERGRRAAALIAAFMKRKKINPDIVLCSPARRTRETLLHIVKRFGLSKETRFLDTLYLASSKQILEQISALPEDARHVLVVGHNPGLETLARNLVDPQHSDEDALNRLGKKYPTGALACFEFDASNWPEVTYGAGKLLSFTTPGDFEKK